MKLFLLLNGSVVKNKTIKKLELQILKVVLMQFSVKISISWSSVNVTTFMSTRNCFAE